MFIVVSLNYSINFLLCSKGFENLRASGKGMSGWYLFSLPSLTKHFMRSLKHTNVGQTKFIIPNSP